ncbi:nucleotidyltransferase domain-containing protein [Candidatus Woesearchaeota archaeon]|nr:nucleotidyltransferase domain-containing protein [Candidatus Woesearchaeota archaeon]
MSQKKDRLLFFRKPIFKIADFIFDNPTKVFHLRMLEKKTGFSTTAVIDAVNELQSYNLINIEKTSLTSNIKANTESKNYSFYKIVFSLYRLKKEVFIDKLIKIFNNPQAIILFGSYAKGEDIEKSDIDLLVISNHENPKDLQEFINIYEKKLGRNINIHTLTSLNKSGTEFKNAVANGIVLHGYIKVI